MATYCFLVLFDRPLRLFCLRRRLPLDCEAAGGRQVGASVHEEVAEEVVLAGLQDLDLLLHDSVTILVEETLTLVLDVVGEMPNDES